MLLTLCFNNVKNFFVFKKKEKKKNGDSIILCKIFFSIDSRCTVDDGHVGQIILALL